MSEVWLTGLLSSYRGIGIPLSLLVEIIVAVLGVLPSFFITAANIAVFGIWWGGGLSVAGESVGAVVAFILYRRGLRSFIRQKGRFSVSMESRLEKFSRVSSSRAFFLVIAFRLLPYMPSGAVTLGAAGSSISLQAFVLGSTLGKIPALAVEIATVSFAMKLPLKGFLALISAVILLWLVIEYINSRGNHADKQT